MPDQTETPKRHEYGICSRCIMDTSADEITFDPDGVCSFCQQFDRVFLPRWMPDETGQRALAKLVDQVREAGRGKPYDCVIGLSGGIDSCYCAYLVKELGLRVLALHVDTGWNSELAVNNIERVVKQFGFDLYTEVINWDEMRDLQVAFLKAGVPNQDIPQDNAIFATIYRFTRDQGIPCVINGTNIATESVLPKSWGYNNMDPVHIRAIHRRFGSGELETYPVLSFEEYCEFRMEFPGPPPFSLLPVLDYVRYDKPKVIDVLRQEIGFKDYGAKHAESRFTKFFQGYYLPKRFGYDKRRAHFSSMILSGLMGREDALAKMQLPPIDPAEIEEDKAFVAKKLRLSAEEMDGLIAQPTVSHFAYPTAAEAIDKTYELRNARDALLAVKEDFLAKNGPHASIPSEIQAGLNAVQSLWRQVKASAGNVR